MTELTKRILVAAVGIPIALALIYIGGFPFFLFLILLSNLSLWEFFQLAGRKGINPFTFFGLFYSTLLQTFYYLLLQNSFDIGRFTLTILIMISFAILPSLLLFFQVWSNRQNTTINVAYTLLGVYWISTVFIAISSIRSLPNFFNLLGISNQPSTIFSLNYPIGDQWSAKFFVVVLGTIWLCDTFAYFIGTAYGKHKLAPRTSPKKSWEGAIAGFLGAIISFAILDFLFGLALPFSFQFLFGSIVGIVGQIGDLAESKIKREFNVKDSSNIIPGHGGILDRLDSIMFTFPTILLVIVVITI